jgi:PAS domain-containing protein
VPVDVIMDAIRTYHDLLSDDLAAASQASLDEQQQRRGLTFGDRPLCTVLRPRFLSPQQYRFLQESSRLLVRAFNRAHEAAVADPAFRQQFHLTEPEEILFAHEPGYRCPMPTSRLDAFFTPGGGLHFTEYNAETPAAAAYSDGLSDVFLTLPVMGAFLSRYSVRPLPARPGVYHALMESFRQWAGRRERPRIAILDWREVPTYSEFVLFESYFRDQGLECVIADPREIEYRNGRLLVGDFHVTLVYKRVLISELIERGGLEQAVVRAVLDGAVCMVNPFRCKLLYKKASLAVLGDERNARLFPADEQQAIRAHIPWTRIVEERHTVYDDRRIDLVPFILEHREQLVLKPNDDYGGKGIVLGWTVDAAHWEQAVRTALATPHVVQQRIELPHEPFPALIDGHLEVRERMLDTAPFVCQGDCVDGCLTRIATDPLLNVTAGGGSTVPAFVVEPR